MNAETIATALGGAKRSGIHDGEIPATRIGGIYHIPWHVYRRLTGTNGGPERCRARRPSRKSCKS
jgi:hypothetical protein